MDMQLKRGLLDVCVLAAIKSAGTYNFFDLPPGLRELAKQQKED